MYRNYVESHKSGHLVMESNEDKVVEKGFGGGWFIKLGFAGYNSPANNGFGYKTKAGALNAVLRYQNKRSK